MGSPEMQIGATGQALNPSTPFLPSFAPTGSEILRSFRSRMGWSRMTLADAIGYSYSYVANIEKGLQPMSDRFSIRLASLQKKHDGHAFVDVDATVLLTPAAIRMCRCGRRYASNTPTRRLCFLCSPPRIKS